MQRSYNKYFIEKNISRFHKIGSTFFLDGLELSIIKKELNKNKVPYNIYEPFKDSCYKIIYKDLIPNISCIKIISDNILSHSSIMGALYNFNVSEEYIGDIIVHNGYYFIILKEMEDYFINNFFFIGKDQVKLKIEDIPIYERNYIDLNIIVKSIRIDNVISHIINLNRSDVDKIIDNKEVILNYNTLTNKSYNLKENDVFSIRRYGKYKYVGIIKNTKKNNYVILVKKFN